MTTSFWLTTNVVSITTDVLVPKYSNMQMNLKKQEEERG